MWKNLPTVKKAVWAILVTVWMWGGSLRASPGKSMPVEEAKREEGPGPGVDHRLKRLKRNSKRRNVLHRLFNGKRKHGKRVNFHRQKKNNFKGYNRGTKRKKS